MELRSRDAHSLVEIALSGQELHLLRGGFAGLVDRTDDQDLEIRIGVARHRMQAVADDLDDAERTTFAPHAGEMWVHDPTEPSRGWTVRAVTPDET